MNKLFLLLFFFIGNSSSAFTIDSLFSETPIILHTGTGDISGTLTTSYQRGCFPVALIIAGSGPTDRDGNNSMMKNDGLKQLAHELALKNIASIRYDKRGIAASTASGKQEADLRFENYITDAEDWIDLLKKDKRFCKVYIIGHSEGSLIGMIAAKNADGFISIAGAGQAADLILKTQLASQPEQVKDISFPILDSLKAGRIVKDVNPMLNSLFRQSVQPYLISWFKYDPQVEIKKLMIPVLILQGTGDIQVSEDDANRLAKANPRAKMIMLENMNHVFKTVTGDRDENIKAYSDPGLPIDKKLVSAIVIFINGK